MLAAYAVGMPALLVDRIVAASFLSRGDTATPLKVTLVGVAVNVALKIALFQPLGAPGLALATAAGFWIKVVGVFALAWRRGWTAPDARLLATFAATLFAAGGLALALTLADGPLALLIGASAALRPRSAAARPDRDRGRGVLPRPWRWTVADPGLAGRAAQASARRASARAVRLAGPAISPKPLSGDARDMDRAQSRLTRGPAGPPVRRREEIK